MSTFTIIVLVVLAYIMQVLLTLTYPYYKYRQNHREHKNRTIGGFTEFINATMGEMYLFLALLPFGGFVLIVLVLVVGLTLVGLEAFYNKFIKNIKI